MSETFTDQPSRIKISADDEEAGKFETMWVAGRDFDELWSRIKAAVSEPVAGAKKAKRRPYPVRKPRVSKQTPEVAPEIPVVQHPDGEGLQAEPKSRKRIWPGPEKKGEDPAAEPASAHTL